jgi:predicted N-formylglutamate amidohydrolase
MSEAAVTLESATLESESPGSESPEPGGLLEADEPRPFALVNEAGLGESGAPLVLLCDHASAFIPRALDSLGLDEAQRARHIALDIGIAEVTRLLAQRLGAPAVLSHFSRLVVDPNRPQDDPTLIPQISDGVIVPGNRELAPEQRAARLAAFYWPYHEAIAGAIETKARALTRQGKAPVIVSMHSFTPVMKGVERPWQVGILWNRDARLPRRLIARLRARGLTVGDNQPYSGRDGHGHTLHNHAEPRGLAHALIELRQDLIDTQQGAADWAALLGEVLADCLAEAALLTVEQH